MVRAYRSLDFRTWRMRVIAYCKLIIHILNREKQFEKNVMVNEFVKVNLVVSDEIIHSAEK